MQNDTRQNAVFGLFTLTLSVILPNVIWVSVVLLNVVAPLSTLKMMLVCPLVNFKTRLKFVDVKCHHF